MGVFITTVLTACATDSMNTMPDSVGGSKVDPGLAYEANVNRYSDGEAEYSGLYNNFVYKATLLNSVIRSDMLEKQAHDYQWDRAHLVEETQKSDKEAENSTIVFLSFYTPDRHNDNLADSKPIWKIYLDVGGQRYEGRARKVHSLITEVQALYPYHTRWNTPYTVIFPIATATVQGQPSTLTITGPLGARSVHFTALAQ